MNAFAIIMAGGSGERFWPLSTPEKPKQFLDLFGGKPLIRHAVDRLEGLIPSDRIFVITANRFLAQTRAALPMLPCENIIGEPCRRDTAAAVATACGLVMRRGGAEAVGCILTADHIIEPVALFQQTLSDAIHVAVSSSSLVTMGIKPTYPETGFGYIESGEAFASQMATAFRAVTRFVEKPDAPTAARYLADGNFLWNAGMFIWKAETMRAAFAEYASDFNPLIESLATTDDYMAVIEKIYPTLRAISVDYAVMEHMRALLVAESRFTWDDVGSWTALEHYFPQDERGNTILGPATLHDVESCVIVNATTDGRPLALACLKDMVVVQTDDATLMIPKSDLAQMKTLVRNLSCTAS